MRRMLLVLLLVAVAPAALAQQDGKFRSAGGPEVGFGRYRVSIAATVAGEERESVIRDLAALYRARLELFGEDGFAGFVAVMSSSAARLLSRDPRVILVEELPLVPADSTTPEAHATESVTATAPAPAQVQKTPVSHVGSAEWSTGTYAYDGSGNVKTIGTETYTYDALNRVTSGTAEAGRKQEYTYDRFGNILTIKTTVTGQPTVETNLNVDGATNRTGLGTYDLNGNMTSYQSIDDFWYDGLGRLKESEIGGARSLYLYSANDERIAVMSVNVSNGTYTELRSRWTLRDHAGRVLRRLAKEGAGAAATWTWVEDYIYREGTLLAAEVPGAHRRLQFHLDHLGTPRLITGDGGAEVARHSYYPFGHEATSPAQDGEALKFTGHERDTASLDYMHARYYNPQWGRFLSVDPTWKSADLGKPQSWNRYSYVLNNPVRYTDPDGRCSAAVIDCVIEGGSVGGLPGALIGLGTGLAIVAGSQIEVGGKSIGRHVGDFMLSGGGSSGEMAAETFAQNMSNHMAEKQDQGSGQTGTIYEVPGESTGSGRPYVGRHNQPEPTKTRRSNDGRDRTKAQVVDTYDATNRQEGRQKEQKAIDDRGGVKNLDNKRNEIAPKKKEREQQ